MKALSYFTFLVFLLCCAVIVWGINKGFDFSDEGLYVLGFQQGQEIFSSPTYFHLLFRKLFFFMELDIITLRVIRFIIYLSGSIFFSWGLLKWIEIHSKEIRLPTLLFFPFIAIGTFIGYSFGPQSLSYNHLSVILLLFSSGCLFLNFAYSEEKNKRIYFASILMAVAGILTGMEIFVRITSGVILVLIYVLLILIHPKNKLNLILLLSGLLLTLLAYFIFIQPFSQYYNGIRNTVYLITSENSHSASSVATKIYDAGIALFIMIIYSLLTSVIYIFIIKKHKLYNSLTTSLKSIVFFFYFILFFFLATRLFARDFLGYKRGGYFLYLLVSFLSVHVVEIFSSTGIKGILLRISQERKKLPILLFLFLCPFILTFGTGNRVLLMTIFGVAFWFGAAAAIFNLYSLRKELMIFFISVSCSVGFFLLVHFFIFHPYRLESLVEQTETIPSLKRAANLMVDKKTKRFTEHVAAVLINNGFHEHDPIIGIYHLPGLIYLVGGLSPGGILWGDEVNQLFCKDLQLSKMNLSKIFFLIRDKHSLEFMDCLKTQGVDFFNYQKIGEAESNSGEYPVTSIYAPVHFNSDSLNHKF
ncbi:MAG: hypothetical protein JJE25_13105 [Bacteroidia bacterium]|nr:hypothetical protein [Bacteroidia bacterium]